MQSAISKAIISSLILSTVFLLSGAEFKLTDQGNPVCTIILPESAGPTETHAANELAKYIGRISGGASPEISNAPEAGKYPVYLELTQDPKVGPEGFKISADPQALRIAGKEPVGVLYGAYEVLKKDGGIRWLLPGKDGEYFQLRPTITVPEGIRIKNPDFGVRNFNMVAMGVTSPVWDTRDWAVRNNMRLSSYEFNHRRPELKEGLDERAITMSLSAGFTPVMIGWGLEKLTLAEYNKKVDKIFAEHPEYFALVRGKRVISYFSGNEPQPCTTNPEVIRRSVEHCIQYIDRAKTMCKDIKMSIANNDCTQWCECERCLAVDPPEEKEDGLKGTRYWTFANAVIEEVHKQRPEVTIVPWTYQNFSRFPKGIMPSKKSSIVMISNHRRCWKHALDDQNCPTNKWYYDYNKEWNDYGIPMFTYEMLSATGHAFLPNEKNWVDTLKYYKREMPMVDGMFTEMSCPDGNYSERYRKSGRELWSKMWQAMYLAMYFHWDINADYDKVYEEINSLYYGRGWYGGMREFRRYLTELYMNGSGCWGYAHSSLTGKFLDVPSAREKLEKLLDDAEKAAAGDPDERALAHVKKDREFFNDSWVKAHNDYVKNFREIKAYPLQGEIVIDGKLDEFDWKNADTITRFRKVNSDDLAQCQTSVKLAYDKNNIYIGAECLEPMPDQMWTTYKNHDDPVWGDNDIEFFINDPILGETYFQICVNAAGTICDGSVTPGAAFKSTYESNAEVKTSIGPDRWFVEMRIPAQSITGSTLSAGNMLRMNVFRCRKHGVGSKENEASTWSLGTPHNVETFHTINFAAPRAVTAGNRHELDTRLWRNGTFNEPASKVRIPKGWKTDADKMPARWGLSDGYTGEFQYQLHPGSTDNYFVTLSGGYLGNDCEIKSDKIAASCRMRGKGKMRFCMLRYTPERKNLPTTCVHVQEVDSTEWKTFSFEFERPGDKNEFQVLILWPEGKESKLDIDDVYLIPRD